MQHIALFQQFHRNILRTQHSIGTVVPVEHKITLTGFIQHGKGNAGGVIAADHAPQIHTAQALCIAIKESAKNVIGQLGDNARRGAQFGGSAGHIGGSATRILGILRKALFILALPGKVDDILTENAQLNHFQTRSIQIL